MSKKPNNSSLSGRVPTYRRHKPSGQGVVSLADGLGGRKTIYLGKYRSRESLKEYARVIAEWEARGRRLEQTAAGPGVSVNELILAFLQHADRHYRHADGRPTTEIDDYKLSVRPLRELYGLTDASKFGPLALEAVRNRMIADGLCRSVVNQRIGRVKRVFRYGVAKQLIAPEVLVGLDALPGLQAGRSAAREKEPIKPIADAVVDATLPHVLPEVAGMIELQRLTGMRPGEVCSLRPIDIDTTGAIWLYRPPVHKLSYRGKTRTIAFGPKAIQVVKRFLPANVEAFVFSPARAMEARALRLRVARKTPVQPSQFNRKKAKAKRRPTDRYTSRSYAQAITYGCRKAGVPHWHANQLRHNHATEVRRRYGLEAASVALGHSKMNTTEIYAEKNASLALKVAAEVG